MKGKRELVRPPDHQGSNEVCGADDEEVEEAAKVRAKRCGLGPTQRELEEHQVSHLPFRSLCPECVAGRAKDDPNIRQEQRGAGGIPEIHMDYCFLRSAEGEAEKQ